MITIVPNESPVLVGDALVEDVPRIEAEAGADLQRHAHAVEDQAGVELQRGGGAWCTRSMRDQVALNSIANSAKVASMLSRSRPQRTASGSPAGRLALERPGVRALAGRCGCSCSTAACRCARGCPASASWPTALGVSRTTATAAYAALRDEGFLASRRGSGSWTRLPADAGGAGARPAPAGEDVIDLSCAACAAPEGALHAALVAASAELPRHLPGPGYDAAGLPALRAAIAAALHRAAACRPRPSRCSSPRARSTPSRCCCACSPARATASLTEHPTYPAALDAVRAVGARPVPVPMLRRRLGPRHARGDAAPGGAAPRVRDPGPPEPDRADAARRRPRAARRAWRARRARRWSSTRRSPSCDLDGGAAPAPVAALDPDGETVITIGSMSKAFWAGLRIGWIRATPALVGRLAAARAALDIGSPVLEQLVAAELLARRRRGARAPARGRRARAATRSSPRSPRSCRSGASRCRPAASRCGSSSTRRAARALAAIADRYGLRLAAGPRFGVDGAFERFVRLPFSLPEPVLQDAAARLAVAWRAVSESAPARRRAERRPGRLNTLASEHMFV